MGARQGRQISEQEYAGLHYTREAALAQVEQLEERQHAGPVTQPATTMQLASLIQLAKLTGEPLPTDFISFERADLLIAQLVGLLYRRLSQPIIIVMRTGTLTPGRKN